MVRYIQVKDENKSTQVMELAMAMVVHNPQYFATLPGKSFYTVFTTYGAPGALGDLGDLGNLGDLGALKLFGCEVLFKNHSVGTDQKLFRWGPYEKGGDHMKRVGTI